MSRKRKKSSNFTTEPSSAISARKTMIKIVASHSCHHLTQFKLSLEPERYIDWLILLVDIGLSQICRHWENMLVDMQKNQHHRCPLYDVYLHATFGSAAPAYCMKWHSGAAIYAGAASFSVNKQRFNLSYSVDAEPLCEKGHSITPAAQRECKWLQFT